MPLRWRLPGIGAMSVLVKSIQTVCSAPDRVHYGTWRMEECSKNILQIYGNVDSDFKDVRGNSCVINLFCIVFYDTLW